MALANGLDRLEGLYLILANFSVGGRSIDLVIIKPDAVFIIELKHCDGKVFGEVNGPWFVESSNGERKRLNPGRKNPYNQVISYFYSLTNFLNDHRRDFLSAHKAESVDFRTCKRVVVIAPTIQEGSKIDLDWKVELKGLDELPAFLVTERSSEIDLTDSEMLAIPELLNCTRWKEINDLVNGVLPRWDAISETPPPPPPEPEPAPAVEPVAVVEPEVVPPPPLTLRQRAGKALDTTTGRIAVGMAALATILLLALVLRPVRVVSAPEGPTTSLVVSTSEAAGSTFGGGARRATCVWNGYQSVRKHWDANGANWVTLGPSAVDPAPDIIVTLEQVNFCSSQITLTWSLRNNSGSAIRLPLSSNSITIRDTLHNTYEVADERSQPSVLQINPGEMLRGSAVVPHPVSQNANTLLVTLKATPFGDATWLVGLDGG